MKFEWDEEKNQKNIIKHGIDFVDVTLAFDHPILKTEDTRKDYKETRFIGIGVIRDREIVIAYTMRSERIRIISARRANEDEREKYRSIYQRYST